MLYIDTLSIHWLRKINLFNLEKEVQSRWKNIRDALRKDCKKFKTSCKSGSAAVKFQRYVFADQLGFLGKVSENRETTSSPPSNHATEEEDEDASGNQATVQPEAVRQSTKKRKMSLEEKMIQFIEGKKEEPDPDHDFFKCILPSVRALQDHQKFDFRMKVLSILQNYNTGHSDNVTPPQTFSCEVTPSHQQYPVFPHSYPPSVMYNYTSVLSTSGHIHNTCQPWTPSPDVPSPSPASHSSDYDTSQMQELWMRM